MYIGVASAEVVPALALHSIETMQRRSGDILDIHIGTTGEQARTAIMESFLKKKEYGALLFMDADHTVPKHTAERLRGHNLDMVSAHYVRRNFPPYPVAFAPDKSWPLHPMVRHPTTGLVEIGATGFGCLYVKRRVVEAVAATLRPGEPMVANYPFPEKQDSWARVGGDLRFCTKARDLGYKLYMDMDLQIGHMTWWPQDMREVISQGMDRPYLYVYRETAERKLRVNGMDIETQEAIRSHKSQYERKISEAQQEINELQGEIHELQNHVMIHRGGLIETQELLKQSGEEQ